MLWFGLLSVPFCIEGLFACTRSLRHVIWTHPLPYLRILIDEVLGGLFKY